jgi:hypothetical protein
MEEIRNPSLSKKGILLLQKKDESYIPFGTKALGKK